MRTDEIRKRLDKDGYRITYYNGSYFAKKHLKTYRADLLNGLYKIIFSNKIYI